MSIKQSIINKIKECDLPYNSKILINLEQYFNLLKEYNEKINLISRTSTDADIINKHFFSSFIFVHYIKMFHVKHSLKLLDIGTGAGFPGVIIAIFFPEIEIYLLDSITKRMNFLDIVKEKLVLNNVKLLNGRAEIYNKKQDYRNSFDIVVSRAVAELGVLSKYALPFMKPEGLFLAIKSLRQEQEIEKADKIIKTLGGKLTKEKFKENTMCLIYK